MTGGEGADDNAVGLALRGQGRFEEAARAFRRAMSAQPENPAPVTNLGTVFQLQGRPAEAVECYRQAIALDPGHADAHNAMGMLAQAQGHIAEAIASYRQAIACRPEHASAHSNLGAALQVAGDFEGAILTYRRAIDLRPEHPEAHYNLGNILQRLHRPDEAASAYRQAIALRPAYAEALNNLGIVLRDQGAADNAVECYRRVLSLRPDHAEAHYNLAMALLELGDLARGWGEYEWRFAAGATSARHQSLPLWRGEPLAGRTLLVWGEQGFGDAIQFARYLPQVPRDGGRLVFEVHEPLLPLMAGVTGADVVIARGSALPPCHFQIPLMSLARFYTPSLDAIPANVPYLRPSPALEAAWRERLAGGEGLRIGLVWAGNPNQANDRNRSMPLAAVRPLLSVAGDRVRWFSLQVGEPARQLTGLEGAVTDLAPLLTNFAETAAALSALDLVITVDTAVAHLAGALGVPAWVMLTFSPDWRWLRQRPDNPWYPSMRLFRQNCPGDWDGVVTDLTGELARLVGAGRQQKIF